MPIQNRDTALQNEVVRLYCNFMKSGTLTNPAAQPMVEVIGSDGSVIIESIPAQMEYDGIWFADWYVPENLPVGTYYDRWTFQWDANSGVSELVMPIQVRTFDNYINFVGKGISHKLGSRVVQLVKDLENFFIYEATHIPLYFEQGMRVQQEDQQKRVKTFYHFEVDDNAYQASEGDVYFNNGNKFTVFSSFDTALYYSSSSSTETSSSSTENESESSSSIDSSTSSESSLSTQSSSSSLDQSTSSTSESDGNVTTSSSLTEEPLPKIILTCVGTGNPLTSGTLTKVSGEGSQTIKYVGFTSKRSKFSTVYRFAFPNWNRDFKPIVYVNQRIVDDGWYADYEGYVYFDRLMTPRDTVNVTYKFSCFSLEHLLAFLRAGLMQMNSVPPASEVYNMLDNMPYEWNGPVLLYAAQTALRRILFGMNFQEKQQIYGGLDAVQQASSIFQGLLQAYSEQWETASKNTKTLKLPGIAMYVTPEYTLPGGRCMSSDTCIKCVVGDEFNNKTISDLFIDFENGAEIFVQSVFTNGEAKGICFAPVSKIWKSGRKEVFLLKTESKSIKLSKDHLVYLPLKEKFAPVSDITRDDSLMIIDDNIAIEKLVEDPVLFGEDETYDIEVPMTENFSGNGIISHNSRWFRYMYKQNS